jgi:hypothetical protein
MAKCSPGGTFGSTLGTKNHPKAHKIQSFCISILHTDFRGPPDPHCGRNRVRITCQKQCSDCAGASGSHVGRLRKKSSWGHIFRRCRRRFGCPPEPPGPFLAQKALQVGRLVRFCCQSYGNGPKLYANRIRAEVKAYLNEKSYD